MCIQCTHSSDFWGLVRRTYLGFYQGWRWTGTATNLSKPFLSGFLEWVFRLRIATRVSTSKTHPRENSIGYLVNSWTHNAVFTSEWMSGKMRMSIDRWKYNHNRPFIGPEKKTLRYDWRSNTKQLINYSHRGCTRTRRVIRIPPNVDKDACLRSLTRSFRYPSRTLHSIRIREQFLSLFNCFLWFVISLQRNEKKNHICHICQHSLC